MPTSLDDCPLEILLMVSQYLDSNLSTLLSLSATNWRIRNGLVPTIFSSISLTSDEESSRSALVTVERYGHLVLSLNFFLKRPTLEAGHCSGRQPVDAQLLRAVGKAATNPKTTGPLFNQIARSLLRGEGMPNLRSCTIRYDYRDEDYCVQQWTGFLPAVATPQPCCPPTFYELYKSTLIPCWPQHVVWWRRLTQKWAALFENSTVRRVDFVDMVPIPASDLVCTAGARFFSRLERFHVSWPCVRPRSTQEGMGAAQNVRNLMNGFDLGLLNGIRELSFDLGFATVCEPLDSTILDMQIGQHVRCLQLDKMGMHLSFVNALAKIETIDLANCYIPVFFQWAQFFHRLSTEPSMVCRSFRINTNAFDCVGKTASQEFVRRMKKFYTRQERVRVNVIEETIRLNPDRCLAFRYQSCGHMLAQHVLARHVLARQCHFPDLRKMISEYEYKHDALAYLALIARIQDNATKHSARPSEISI